MTSFKAEMDRLVGQRDALEIEAAAIADELNSVGPNGEPPAGVKEPLVDAEGFPRGDIDLFLVRQKRHRLAEISTDHKEIMKKIEHILPSVYSTMEPTNIIEIPPEPNSTADDYSVLRPVATINEILPDSPASSAGVRDNDLLLSFGGIDCTYPNPFSSIPNVVRDSINRPLSLVVRRNDDILRLVITPRPWGGRGLLGFHLSPLS
jgi:26S proteasome non-ATPase regulatory subunit 9